MKRPRDGRHVFQERMHAPLAIGVRKRSRDRRGAVGGVAAAAAAVSHQPCGRNHLLLEACSEEKIFHSPLSFFNVIVSRLRFSTTIGRHIELSDSSSSSF